MVAKGKQRRNLQTSRMRVDWAFDLPLNASLILNQTCIRDMRGAFRKTRECASEMRYRAGQIDWTNTHAPPSVAAGGFGGISGAFRPQSRGAEGAARKPGWCPIYARCTRRGVRGKPHQLTRQVRGWVYSTARDSRCCMRGRARPPWQWQLAAGSRQL